MSVIFEEQVTSAAIAAVTPDVADPPGVEEPPARLRSLVGDRPLPVTSQGWKTRQRLIDAAIDEFADHGYVGARVETITERAGFGYGTFYRYFASKVDLIDVLADEVFDDLLFTVNRDQSEEFGVAERMFHNILRFMRIFYRNREVFLVLDDAVGSDPTIASRIRELEINHALAYADKILRLGSYHPIADPFVVTDMTATMGFAVSRRFIRSAQCTGMPSVDAPRIERVARIATLMTMAALDPVALGIDPSSVDDLMKGIPTPTDEELGLPVAAP